MYLDYKRAVFQLQPMTLVSNDDDSEFTHEEYERRLAHGRGGGRVFPPVFVPLICSLTFPDVLCLSDWGASLLLGRISGSQIPVI